MHRFKIFAIALDLQKHLESLRALMLNHFYNIFCFFALKLEAQLTNDLV
jgi:hypothetical protein